MYINDIITNPDYIINDNKNIDTILYIKRIKEKNKNIQIVIKLNTNVKEKKKQNSILTMWKIRDKGYKQLVKNKEILWKKVDNKE